MQKFMTAWTLQKNIKNLNRPFTSVLATIKMAERSQEKAVQLKRAIASQEEKLLINLYEVKSKNPGKNSIIRLPQVKIYIFEAMTFPISLQRQRAGL